MELEAIRQDQNVALDSCMPDHIVDEIIRVPLESLLIY